MAHLYNILWSYNCLLRHPRRHIKIFALHRWPLCPLICMLSIGVHALMSGTAASDFGGRKATATAAGITDGFVYLGGAIQSASLGVLVTKDWAWWPLFLIPFAIIGLVFTLRMWNSLPKATHDYLVNVEKVDLSKKGVISSDAKKMIEARV